MQSITLTNGEGLTVDLARVRVKEFRAIFDKNQPQADEDATIAKAAGLTVEELLELPVPDYRAIIRAVFADAKATTDPN